MSEKKIFPQMPPRLPEDIPTDLPEFSSAEPTKQSNPAQISEEPWKGEALFISPVTPPPAREPEPHNGLSVLPQQKEKPASSPLDPKLSFATATPDFSGGSDHSIRPVFPKIGTPVPGFNPEQPPGNKKKTKK